MITRRRLVALATTSAAFQLPLVQRVPAQAPAPWPTRVVKLIVPFTPGGGIDGIARILGGRLSEMWGQQVVVENKPGAGGNIASEQVARSTPDGYTMYISAAGLAINRYLFPSISYDPIGDFAPVTLITATPFMLVVHPSVAAHSVAELVALARSKPGQLNYGSSGNGSSIHLTTELLKTAAKIDMTHVPYKGSGPAFIDLIGGQIQILFSSTVSSLPHVKSGKARGIAITSLKRASSLPAMPTVAESYPGFESSSWFGMLVPAKTPKPILDRLLADTRSALKSPEVNQALVSQGAEPGGNSPTEFAAYFQSEITKWGRVIDAAAIKLDQ